MSDAAQGNRSLESLVKAVQSQSRVGRGIYKIYIEIKYYFLVANISGPRTGFDKKMSR